MANEVQRRILVVDNGDYAATVADALTAVGYVVSRTPRGLAGLVAVEEEEPALIVLSWGMPFIDGRVFLAALRAGLPMPPPVVALVDPSDDPALVREAGAHAVLSKPVDTRSLVDEVGRLLARIEREQRT